MYISSTDCSSMFLIVIYCVATQKMRIWHHKRVASTNRARRMAKEAKDAPVQPAPEKARVDVKKFVKIGRPGYRGEYTWPSCEKQLSWTGMVAMDTVCMNGCHVYRGMYEMVTMETFHMKSSHGYTVGMDDIDTFCVKSCR